ncbi:hypothetical protein G6F43_013160 [Rhizopus delemar]|nr:hypothetical protein G6F43_013160 [Rhizopus delemar]
MDTSRNRNQLHHTQYNGNQHIRPNQQQDLIGLIQQAIRQELNSQQYQQQPTRNNRYNGYNNNYNRSGRYGNNDNNGRYDNSNRNYMSNQRRSYDLPAIKKLLGSVAFDNSQKNGQLNTQKDTKSINNHQQQQLNAILTDKYNSKQKDLYAAIRPERPPDVATITPYPNSRPTNKEKGKQVAQQTMALIEDEEINTTAAYSTVSIGDKNIKALVDSGASKTCMSKALADALELEIDSASENVFTLGNGTKQPALGLIYDVPIEVKEDMVIPCTIEVLPSCPSHLILGSNWLNRAKAKIDFNSSSLKVKYKNQKAELPIRFIRKSTPLPKMKTFHQAYQHPTSLTNSNSEKHVHFEDRDSEGSYSSSEEEDESESESDDDIEMEVTALERNYEQESLQVLENDKYEEVVITNSQEIYSIKSTDTGFLMQAHSSKHISLDKSKEDTQNILIL